ncbi:hypothetical protein [Rufibacter sp. LB8]|uniref:hypothetical protein n=1 Tax=Rufibacter sp. LB8 TaxID=2777781 RepID=UPI00178C6141|nr:hypothetical protein [Rufibacter sp. LB8]
MKNTLFLILFAVVLFLAIYFYWGKSNAESQLAMNNERITSLEEQVRRYTNPSASTDTALAPTTTQPPLGDSIAIEEKVPPTPSTTFEEELGVLSDSDVKRLKRAGLKNPETDLMNDLMRKQKSVLTNVGVKGGTMAIHDVRILNDRYAMAYFEDGHFGGNMVLRYSVDNGAITWIKLDSYIQ